jgi:Ala-tRNA(Pro) deacylase
MGIRDFLTSQHVPYETLLHRPAPCATRRAQTLHVPGERVAKAVLVRAGDGFVLAVLPATHRIDLGRFGDSLGIREPRIASEQDTQQVFFDCERGAIPPFGRLYGLTTVIDASLIGGAEIVFEGNMRHEGLRMRLRDFESIETPVRARFATATDPRRRRPTRRAG